MKKILIIEDDQDISKLQRDYLEMSGYTIDCALDGDTGLSMLKNGDYNLVILDLMLPKKNGFDILSQIANDKNIPILIVSAKTDEISKIKGLNLGADDYITKPFGMGELVARVNSHIKKYEKFTKVHEKRILINALSIDKQDRRIFMNEEEIILTHKEFDLLLFLAENTNTVFSRETLFEKVWGFDALSDTTTVTVHIARIREKLEKYTNKEQYIETVWGTGYRLRDL